MSVLDLFFPRRCTGCGKPGAYFCPACRRGIRFIGQDERICPVCGKHAIDGWTHPACRSRSSPNRLISFFHYDGIVRDAVRLLKYRLVSDMAAEFASCIPDEAFHELIGDRSFVVIPVPLHRRRYLERGFNQAEILGGAIARRLHIPMCSDMLRRTRATVPQVSMKSRDERLGNMKNVFRLENPITDSIGRNTWLLFDDVYTTGSTVRSATSVLRHGGAESVWAVTMAR